MNSEQLHRMAILQQQVGILNALQLAFDTAAKHDHRQSMIAINASIIAQIQHTVSLCRGEVVMNADERRYKLYTGLYVVYESFWLLREADSGVEA